MISDLLFARPFLLGGLCAAAQLALIGIWSWTRSRSSARAVWIGFGAIPLLLLTSLLVETPTEQIISLCRQLARDIDDGDINSFGDSIAPDFAAAGLDRTQMLQRLTTALTRARVDHPRLTGFDVTTHDDNTASASFHASCRIRTETNVVPFVPTRWKLVLRRHSAAWLVTDLESIPVPPLNIRDLRDWLR